MSIFDKIKNAIFGDHAKSAPVAPKPEIATPVKPANASLGPQPTATPTVSTTAHSTAAAGTSEKNTAAVTPISSAPTSGASTPKSVDVSAILDKAVADKGQKLDWRHSIVDLMKALGMEASLAERKELADELHYTGDMHDSAKMNMFLHKALMQKLAENGGHVPADLAA